MANEPEVIRQQMDETRSNLTEKLEMLENQVVETVHGASHAVAETVQSVKESVKDTVSSVKETFDLRHQVAARPWSMVAGAAAVGFLGGCLLPGRRTSAPMTPSAQPFVSRPNGNGSSAEYLGAGHPGKSPEQAAPNWLSSLGETFEEEINQVKGLAVGTLLGLVRDMVAKAVPGNLERKVADVMDGLTIKLGGQPVKGPILPEARADHRHDERETSASGSVLNGPQMSW
jgi:ElaB/YqjD/DUF883 family membrane-anchored ribosome-binding protein